MTAHKRCTHPFSCPCADYAAELERQVADLERRLHVAEQDVQLEHSGRLIAEERLEAKVAEVARRAMRCNW